jgi:hypothetical protein
MRAIKSSLDQLLKRIESEAYATATREEKQLIAELRKQHTADILEYNVLREKLDRVEDRLEKAGLRADTGSLSLSRACADKITEKHQAHKRRFHTMRNNIIIRLGLADEDEKKFMVRNFFEEVGKAYPTLQAVLGKLNAATYPMPIGKITKIKS